MLYSYSVTRLCEDNFEKRCEDIIDLVKNNAISMPLFSMSLVPEGVPVWDKVGKMLPLYRCYRDELSKHGVECGILVQSSLGHGFKHTPGPFTKYVNVFNCEEEHVCCPEDREFIEHFCGVLKQLAAEHPKVIMLDDDFRMMARPGKGCVCPLHMKKFNDITGLNWTKEELSKHIFSHDENDKYTEVFRNLQIDSLVKTAHAFRDAIDSVDPTIQGVNCTSGHICESVALTNKVFAGKGNPTIVRVPNGIYSPLTTREFSELMYNAAVCSSKLKKNGIDIVLAESDTIPYNRYGKSARYLHTHYTGSILEGLKGAKHWLSRGTAFEFDSGVAYRKTLKDNYGFYSELEKMSDVIEWIGCGQIFMEQKKYIFNNDHFWKYHNCAWSSKNFERMGIPFYFSEESNGTAFLEGGMGADMSDEQINQIFKGSVFTDAESAEALFKRGYGHLLGVEISEWDKGLISGEVFANTDSQACQKQKNAKTINIIDKNVRVESYNYVLDNGEKVLLSPAVTVLKRDNGKITVVYCGTPDAEYFYTEGFSFLNETRKQQFVNLLTEANALPVYCKGDDEVCLRAGYLGDGTLLAMLFGIGTDPMEPTILYLKDKPTTVEMLCADGSRKDVSFNAIGDNFYKIAIRVEIFNPVILLIK